MQLFIDVLLSKLERNTKKEIETLSFKRSFALKTRNVFSLSLQELVDYSIWTFIPFLRPFYSSKTKN